MNFGSICVLGPGLLGGSLLLALRHSGTAANLRAWARRPAALEQVRALGAADTATTDLAVAVGGAGLVVLCTPVESMPALVGQFRDHLAPGAIVTDVGSVKAPVVRALSPLLHGRGRFVGSHPMAGSEQAGLEAASPDLFEDATCIVTPVDGTDSAALAAIEAFWRLLGCRVERMSPDDHDRIIALVSHVPHAVAAVLVNLVCGGEPNPLNFCGSGFKDTTRIASGPPAMWREILTGNRANVAGGIDALISLLARLRDDLLAGDAAAVEASLAKAKEMRDSIL